MFRVEDGRTDVAWSGCTYRHCTWEDDWMDIYSIGSAGLHVS